MFRSIAQGLLALLMVVFWTGLLMTADSTTAKKDTSTSASKTSSTDASTSKTAPSSSSSSTAKKKQDAIDTLFAYSATLKLTPKQKEDLDKLRSEKEQPLRDAMKAKDSATDTKDKKELGKKYADLKKEVEDTKKKIITGKGDTTTAAGDTKKTSAGAGGLTPKPGAKTSTKSTTEP
jgi:hypothetical protein